MQAFVEMVQRKEREEEVDQLTHQRWSGANLKDKEVELASGLFKVSTQALKVGCTEDQFAKKV